MRTFRDCIEVAVCCPEPPSIAGKLSNELVVNVCGQRNIAMLGAVWVVELPAPTAYKAGLSVRPWPAKITRISSGQFEQDSLKLKLYNHDQEDKLTSRRVRYTRAPPQCLPSLLTYPHGFLVLTIFQNLQGVRSSVIAIRQVEP